MTLIAKNEPGGAAGYVWEKGGDEGAIEVDDLRVASDLLNNFADSFYPVTPVEKTEKVKEEKPKAAVKAGPVKKEKTPVEDTEDELSKALKVSDSISNK